MFLKREVPGISRSGVIAGVTVLVFVLSACNFRTPVSGNSPSGPETTVEQTTTTSGPETTVEQTTTTSSAEDLAGISQQEQELFKLVNELRADPDGVTGGKAAECEDWNGEALPALELAPKIAVEIADPQATRQSIGPDGKPLLVRYNDTDLAKAKTVRDDLTITWMNDLLSAVAGDSASAHLKQWTDSKDSLCWLINDEITHAAPAIVEKSATTLAGTINGTVASFTILITE